MSVSSKKVLILMVILWLFGTYAAARPCCDIENPEPEYLPKITEGNVEIDKIKLHYIRSGPAPTVVLLHGNPGNIEDFRFGTIDTLTRHYRVIAFDRPGHGKSERPTEMPSPLDDQARLIHDALAKLGIDRPILVGHSWGGTLALNYAIKYPGDVASLVLIAPAAYPDGGESPFLKAVMKIPVVSDITFFVGSSLFSRSILKKELERAFEPQKVPSQYAKMARSSWLGRRQMKAYLDDELALDGDLKLLSKRYSEIDIPTVIVTGRKDRVVSPTENAYRLHNEIRNSRLVELPNAGHEIPLTNPESIAAALNSLTRPAAKRPITKRPRS